MRNKLIIDNNFPHLGGNVYGGDKHTYNPILWDYLIKSFNIKSVLDVGGGEGQSLEYFLKCGCKGLMIDGLESNITCAKSKNIPSIKHDLVDGPFIANMNIDLVWCCEVVEHIDEKYIDNLLNTITQGQYLALTHATPRQKGYHHVNCQTKEYWLTKLNVRKFNEIIIPSEYIDENTYFKKSGILLRFQ